MATLAVLADAASAANQFIDVFLYVYILLIFAYVLTSWVPRPCRPAAGGDRAVVRADLARAGRVRRPDRAAPVGAEPTPGSRVAAAHDARLGGEIRPRAEGACEAGGRPGPRGGPRRGPLRDHGREGRARAS